MIDVLLAVPELQQEQDLVAAAPTRGLRIVRRCVDTVDLLAAAAAAPLAVAIVSAGLPRLSGDAVARICAGRDGRLIGLAENDASGERLRQLGCRRVARCGLTATDTAGVLAGLLAGPLIAGSEEPGGAGPSGVWPTGCWPAGGPDAGVARGSDADAAGGPDGRLLAVWGAMGSPGRTTVAIGVAEALADSGRRVCLVDADTYAPGVGLALGILDEAGGLIVACRHAENGSLGPATLRASTRVVHGTWQVLAGLPRAERWPDLRAVALERVWEACRASFDVTVVDVGFCLEDDDGPGAWGRKRHAAALTAMAAADHVLVVADAGPAGAARLLSAWPQARVGIGSTPLTVVRNRGRGPGRDWASALGAGGIDAPIHSVPADVKALTSCWSHGRSLGEAAPRSGIRRALGKVAAVAVSG